MNVTSIEWRDIDPHERRFPSGQRRRRAPQPADSGDDDVVEIHSQADEETADGLDECD
jgi:hypothetical protein